MCWNEIAPKNKNFFRYIIYFLPVEHLRAFCARFYFAFKLKEHHWNIKPKETLKIN